ncbi:MAG: hypothetical protein H6R18_589 [Proteobacteria bacterium]|nr:hypothetical protein [Pseudomonadota bacterium]
MSANLDDQAKSMMKNLAELGRNVPQIINHRVTQMAFAGPFLSEHQRQEYQDMFTEKTVAFNASWSAMFMQALRTNQTLMDYFLRSCWSPWLGMAPSVNAVATELQGAAMGVLEKGMAPVYQQVTANARHVARASLQ